MESIETTRKRLESSDWNGMLLREYRTLIEAAGNAVERKRLTEELGRNLRDFIQKK